MLVSKVEELIASSHHPVIQPERLGKMEIIAGGTTRMEGEEPSLSEQRRGAQVPAESELTRQSIVPDRFDDMEEPAAGSRQPQGIHTVPLTSDSMLPTSAAFQREEIPPTPAPEAPPETWDELASDLGTAASPEPFRETGAPAFATPPAPERHETPKRETNTAPWSSPEPVPGPGQPPPSPESASPGVLSAADVERVAARVVEQMSEKIIREIAWEVIPELAESLIRRRIQDLEDKISRES
jgi:hypothetical protein